MLIQASLPLRTASNTRKQLGNNHSTSSLCENPLSELRTRVGPIVELGPCACQELYVDTSHLTNIFLGMQSTSLFLQVGAFSTKTFTKVYLQSFPHMLLPNQNIWSPGSFPSWKPKISKKLTDSAQCLPLSFYSPGTTLFFKSNCRKKLIMFTGYHCTLSGDRICPFSKYSHCRCNIRICY